MKFTAKMPIT